MPLPAGEKDLGDPEAGGDLGRMLALPFAGMAPDQHEPRGSLHSLLGPAECTD
ncbi:MAG: hypothetical protein M3Z06_05560 [Actinomycetota bacterium]|nr:hypothetical protein [Actinomycetota bacterium]